MKKKLFNKVRRVFFISNEKGNKMVSSCQLNGNVVIRSLEKGIITKASIEAARKAIKRVIRKNGQLIMRISAFLPITSKPNEVRMGKGKGKIVDYICPVKAGQYSF